MGFYSSKHKFEPRGFKIMVHILFTIGSSVVEENEMQCRSHLDEEDIVDEDGDGIDDNQYLKVNVVKGEVLSDDYDLFGTIDAYVEIEYDGKKKRTKAVKNSTTPTWNQNIIFNRAEKGKKMR